jgi:hypothetical protein
MIQPQILVKKNIILGGRVHCILLSDLTNEISFEISKIYAEICIVMFIKIWSSYCLKICNHLQSEGQLFGHSLFHHNASAED